MACGARWGLKLSLVYAKTSRHLRLNGLSCPLGFETPEPIGRDVLAGNG